VPIVCWVAITYYMCAGLTYAFLTINKSAEELVALGHRLEWLFMSWFGTTAAVDIIIAATLCAMFLQMKSNVSEKCVD
jgi:hypothetical protein